MSDSEADKPKAPPTDGKAHVLTLVGCAASAHSALEAMQYAQAANNAASALAVLYGMRGTAAGPKGD
jgi:hypothetical protein